MVIAQRVKEIKRYFEEKKLTETPIVFTDVKKGDYVARKVITQDQWPFPSFDPCIRLAKVEDFNEERTVLTIGEYSLVIYPACEKNGFIFLNIKYSENENMKLGLKVKKERYGNLTKVVTGNLETIAGWIQDEFSYGSHDFRFYNYEFLEKCIARNSW